MAEKESKKILESESEFQLLLPLSKPSPLPQIMGFVTQVEVDQDVEKTPGDSLDRDAALARVVTEKRLALIKAWEESEKTKADNMAYKKLSTIAAWEDAKRAMVEAKLKQIEEEIEKKKTLELEKMRNKMAEIHKAAEEKRALTEAKRREDFLDVDEVASKLRASGTMPTSRLRLFKCFCS